MFPFDEPPPKIPYDAWLYIAMDVDQGRRSKLGMTLKPLSRTGTATANPGLLPIVHLPVPASEAKSIENYLHSRADGRISHMSTGNASEWFDLTPPELLERILQKYVNSVPGLYVYYCDGVPNRLHELAIFPEIGKQLADALSERPWSTVERYIAACNGVRALLGASPLPY